ncbi:hypothetical protein E4T56_gene13456 [Termitomyces sp. T112]|nr:hypothetical protein E4T56_gene13456 [Termitomyces sp. T112]
MAPISSLGLSSQEEKKALQGALEELNRQLILYESLGKGPEQSEEERRQASKVIGAMQKVSRTPTDIKMKADYQRKLQARRFLRANRKERRDQVNDLLKELTLAVQLCEETSNEGKELSTQNKDEMAVSKEEAWKIALDELNEQLVLYGSLGQGAEHISEEKEQAAKVVVAMHKVSDAHTDPKVKEEFLKKAEKFEKANPEERKKQMNALLKGLMILLASPFLLAGAAIFVAGSILYGVGSIVKGLGDLVTGGLWNSTFRNEGSDASESSQEERK